MKKKASADKPLKKKVSVEKSPKKKISADMPPKKKVSADKPPKKKVSAEKPPKKASAVTFRRNKAPAGFTELVSAAAAPVAAAPVDPTLEANSRQGSLHGTAVGQGFSGTITEPGPGGRTFDIRQSFVITWIPSSLRTEMTTDEDVDVHFWLRKNSTVVKRIERTATTAAATSPVDPTLEAVSRQGSLHGTAVGQGFSGTITESGPGGQTFDIRQSFVITWIPSSLRTEMTTDEDVDVHFWLRKNSTVVKRIERTAT